MGCWDLPAPARAQKATHVMAVALPHGKAEPLLDAFDAEGLDVCGMDVRAPPSPARAARSPTARGSRRCSTWGGARPSCRCSTATRSSTAARSPSRAWAACATLVGRLRVEGEVVDYLLAEAGLKHGSRDKATDAAAAAAAAAAGPDEFPPEARSLLCGHVDAVAQDLQASFAYAVHQYPDAAVTRLLLVGGGAAVPGLAEYLAAAVRIDTRVASPALLAEVPTALAMTCASPALTAALGLAMYPRE